jgi:hypothetical protein
MVVDPDQEIGTLFGLKNKLVLRPVAGEGDRRVLIPEGEVTYQKTSPPLVTVDSGTVRRLCEYRLDTTLRRLLDDGSLQSKLYLCLLHAVTSHCLVDPFTGYTGTEAALKILWSTAVRSFQFLRAENTALLIIIGGLSPSRAYHSDREVRMQSVTWDEQLGMLLQHPFFRQIVRDIFRDA